jgi:hypothetical protein
VLQHSKHVLLLSCVGEVTLYLSDLFITARIWKPRLSHLLGRLSTSIRSRYYCNGKYKYCSTSAVGIIFTVSYPYNQPFGVFRPDSHYDTTRKAPVRFQGPRDVG